MNWYEWPDSRAIKGGGTPLVRFNSALEERKKKYPDYKPTKEALNIASVLEKKGYYHIEKCLDIDQIDRLKEAFDRILLYKHHDNYPYKLKGGGPNDIDVRVEQKTITIKEVLPFLTNDLIIDIAGAYLGCYPAFCALGLRKEFLGREEGGTQHFHVDPNSPKFLKFFIYLTDTVDNTHCYVEGSHRRKFEDFESPYRQPTKRIKELYGEDKIKYFTTKKGDLLMADTNGFHRGTPPIEGGKQILTIQYECHPDYFNPGNLSMMQQSLFDKIDSKYNNIFDYIEVIK